MATQRVQQRRPTAHPDRDAKPASRERTDVATSTLVPHSTSAAPSTKAKSPSREPAWEFGKVPVHASALPKSSHPQPNHKASTEEGNLPPVLQSALQSSGHPLDSGTRRLMERRVGYDFGAVRVHTDAQAAASARALNAIAITKGPHILFGAGAYAAHQPHGHALLAHELVHVVQHRSFAASTNRRLLSDRNDAAERQADALAHGVAAGSRASAWSPAAPSSILSLAPSTWYRGFAVGVPSVDDGKVVHDLGGGVYFTDTPDVAHQYASLRSGGNQAIERVVTGTVDPHSLGPVYDLREDAKFMEYYNHLRTTGPVSGERYRNLAESVLKTSGKKIEDFAVIIGPEGIRGGTQMVIRNPQTATSVISSMTPVAGGSTPPPATGTGGGSGPAQPPADPNPGQGAAGQGSAGGAHIEAIALPTGKVPAMTPEDMFNKLIAARGFDEHIPAGKLEDTRTQLKQMESDLKTNPTPELQRNYNRLLSQYNISTPEASGGPAGAGYNTYAVVQVVGPDGNIIAVAEGKYTGDLHAEQIALQKLDAQLGGQPVKIARIDVVSDKAVCPDVCVKAFEQFSEKYNVGKVDSFVFRRAKAVGTGMASEKTTARTATAKYSDKMTPVKEQKTIVSRSTGGPSTPPISKGDGGQSSGKAGAAQANEHLPVDNTNPLKQAKAGGEVGDVPAAARPGTAAAVGEQTHLPPAAKGEPDPAAPRARVGAAAEEEAATPGVRGLAREGDATESIVGGAAKSAVKGAVVSLGTGLALYLIQGSLKEMVLDDLAALPQPQPDKRSARAYLSDPKAANGMRALDVLTRNLGQFTQDLEAEHSKIYTESFLQMLQTVSLPEKTNEQYEKKIEQFGSIQSALDAWEQKLLTIDSNLDALLDMEGQLKQLAASAQSTRQFLSHIGVGDELLKMGFTYEEYVDLLLTLDELSQSVAITLTNAHKAKETVRRLLDETADMDHLANKKWWDEVAGQFQKLLKDQEAAKRKAQERSMLKTKAQYGSLEGLEPLSTWNSDQLGMWSLYKTRESEILFQLNELTKTAANSPEAFGHKVELEEELGSVRQKILEMLRLRGGPPPPSL